MGMLVFYPERMRGYVMCQLKHVSTILLLQIINKTDFPVIKAHVDELSSAQIWQHKLCATLSSSVNINYRLSPLHVLIDTSHIY
jgi:hypothetical protein